MRPTAERARELLDYDQETGALTWRVGHRAGARAGGDAGRGYRTVSIDGRRYLEHRLIWLHVTGEWPSNEVDHRDKDRGNNRWCNLRLATHPQNSANRRVRNQTGFKGVWLAYGREGRLKRGKWRAHFRGKYLGTFTSPEEAHEVHMKASREHFGEFASAGNLTDFA